MKHPNAHTIFLKEVDFGEVYKIVRDLDVTKSGDIYDISPKLLQLGANELSKNLTLIFNKSLFLGKFPEKLKLVKVIPIYKAESRQEPGNYRPISLLPIIGKIFEKIVYNRVYNFITEKNILVDRKGN